MPALLACPGGGENGDASVLFGAQKGLVAVDDGNAVSKALSPKPDVGGFARAAGGGEQIRLAFKFDGGTVKEKDAVSGKGLADGSVNADQLR